MKLTILPTLIFTVAAQAQQVGTNANASTGDSTFKASSQLVIETVVVKDKNGKAVEGLTANDFKVTEDGTPQTIRFFEHQNMSTDATVLAPVTESVAPFDRLPRNRITVEKPGDSRYKDRRLLVLYFDMTAMP